ncbi:MAG: HAD family hydrolase [Bacteroidota bacterium]
MKPEIIVFDLYNTLVKIETKTNGFTKIFQNCSEAIGITHRRFIDLILTQDIDDLIRRFPSKFQEELERFLPAIEAEINSTLPFPETQSVLENLASKYDLFLISNLATPYKRPYYELELSTWFNRPIFSCDVGFRKPDTQIFEKIELASKRSGNQILMIGDSISSDIEGAKKMNWNYLRINRNSMEWKAWEISSLNEIENRIN